jgi:hypothetical protein
MRIKIWTLLAAGLASALIACSGSDSGSVAEPNRTDSDGLIVYAMPDGWTNTRISTGDHFSREAQPDDPTVLGVVARKRHPSVSIEQIQTGTIGKHELQGHKLVEQSTTDRNGFTVWEALYEADIRGQSAVFHNYFLFSDDLQVEVSLNTPGNEYESLLPDLHTVVESVQAKTSSD